MLLHELYIDGTDWFKSGINNKVDADKKEVEE